MVARRSGGEALCMNLRIANIDPQGEVALSLLGEAAADVRPLYSSASGSAPPPVTRRVSVMSYGWIRGAQHDLEAVAWAGAAA